MDPIVQQIKNEKHFCFTVQQSRIIAEKLTQETLNDSIIKKLYKNTITYQKLIQIKDSTISRLNHKTKNFQFIYKNQDSIIGITEFELNTEKRKLRKSKFINKLFGAGLIAVTGILILK